jgi:hypothetical protein
MKYKTLLLGHLAQFASFQKQGELLCTHSLAHLLQNPRAKAKFAFLIGRLAHIKLKENLTWHAEERQRDGGRPDLAGRANGKLVVKIEAKLGAKLDKGQICCYAKDLQKNGSASATLLVVVPLYRVGEAKEVVHDAFQLSGHGPWRLTQYPQLSVAVITWNDVLDVLSEIGSQDFRNDLDQLRAMYRFLTGDYTEPLAGSKELARWREREPDFDNWVDRATRLLKLKTDRNRYPMQREKVPEGGEITIYHRRYVGRPYGKEKEPFCCFSIGVRDPFIRYKTPIWLRFHKDTRHFSEVRDLLLSSAIKEKRGVVRSGGHIWIPLGVKFNVGTDEIVKHLIRQAQAVLKIAHLPTL